MLRHIAEYIASLEMLVGERWRTAQPALSLLSSDDLEKIELVRSETLHNDDAFAKAKFGDAAEVDSRYRKYVSRLGNRLVQVILCCPIEPSLASREKTTFTCLRHLCMGETLLRTKGAFTTQMHLGEVVSRIDYPELVWYAPPAHISLAYFDAVNERGRIATRRLALFRAACNEAVVVSSLLDFWMQLYIPTDRKAELAKRPATIKRAKEFLRKVGLKPTSGVVAIAAARVATTISQLQGNKTLALRWLERSRLALKKESRFTVSTARAYHSQRAFVFRSVNDYINGVADAKKVIALSSPKSSDWYSANNTLLGLQLRSGLFKEAVQTAHEVTRQKNAKQQPALRMRLIKLRELYAKLLTHDYRITLDALKEMKDYPLDASVLRVLVLQGMENLSAATDAMFSLGLHIDRNKATRKDRGYWILSRLIRMFAKHGMNLKECRKIVRFKNYELELPSCKTSQIEHTVIIPLSIWKAIIAKR